MFWIVDNAELLLIKNAPARTTKVTKIALSLSNDFFAPKDFIAKTTAGARIIGAITITHGW